FLMDGVDEDELGFLVAAPDAVDNQLVGMVKRDADDVVSVSPAGEKGGHVELRLCCRGDGRQQSKQQERCGEIHCRPASRASTIVGSASVEMSPNPPVAPSAILR